MSIDVKKAVGRAIASEWSAFAERHPNLASVLDETLLIDGAIRNLADDPEYQEAMATAAAVGAGAEVVTEIVGRFVRGWLGRLV